MFYLSMLRRARLTEGTTVTLSGAPIGGLRTKKRRAERMPPDSWPTNTRFLSATLPPLLQRRSLEKFSDGFALVSPESSPDKFSEPRASLTGIAYGSKCGVQEHSEVPPVCLPASIHLIVALSSSSV